MNDWTHRTLIVAAQDVGLARALCEGLAEGDAGKGMFLRELSPTGTGPATHFISAGQIWRSFAELLGNAQATFERAGGMVPLEAIEGLYARATFSEDEPKAVMDSLWLQFVVAAEDAL
jgi:hypothetical protein